MNLQKVNLRYMGWCPGVDSAAMFVPDKVHSTKRLITVSIPIIIAILLVAVRFLLFYTPTLPPSQILANKIVEPKPSEEFVSVEGQELSNYPLFAEAIKEADRASKSGIWVTSSGNWIVNPRLALKMTHEEGREIIHFLGGEYTKKIKYYSFKITLDGSHYQISIDFGEGTLMYVG